MNDQEWEDGKAVMDEAREKVLRIGRWTHRQKAEAVFAVGMMTDAETGVTIILQDFVMHSEGQFPGSWKEYISNEFEKQFTNNYKNLKEPQPPSEQSRSSASKTS